MAEFTLHRPESLAQALALLAELGPRGRALAGGTDLIIDLRKGAAVSDVVDLSRLGELAYIREQAGAVQIGALTTHSAVAESSLVQKQAGLLAQAAAVVGSPQIRNRGTIGGNVANAAVCADTVPPLVALGATVKLQRQGASRILPLIDFITGPRRTCIEPGELLTELSFAKLPASAGWGFMRLARRQAVAIARLNVAVVIDRDSAGAVVSARIAPGAVLARPGCVQQAAAILIGKRPDASLIRQAGEAVAAALVAGGRRWSTPYKEPAIIALTTRAIKQALEVEWK